MMIAPARQSARPSAGFDIIPAPLGGLVANKPVTSLGPKDALVLDNWLCRSDGLTVRNGYTLAAVGHGAVSHLMGRVTQLFSCAGTAIRPVSGIGASATLSSTGLPIHWDSTVVTNEAGIFLVATTGAHMPYVCDGSTWAPSSIFASTYRGVAVDPIKLMGPVFVHNRLWFYERGSLRLWYLAPGAVSGEARPVYAEAIAGLGGEFVGLGVLDGDGGPGPDDRIVAVTSRGEIVVYAGTNPDDMESFDFGGCWKAPKPIGKRSLTKIGGDLGYLCTDGMLSVQGLIAKPDSKKKTDGMTEAIRPLIAGHLAATFTAPEWRAIDSLSNAFALINGPGGVQYVLCPETGKWSRLRGLNATCWLENDGNLYFGTSGGVIASMSGHADNGDPIQSLAISGWTRLKGAGRKVMQRARPVFEAPQPYRPRIEILRDFATPADGYPAGDLASAFWNWPEVYEGATGVSLLRPVSNRIGQWRGLSGHAQDSIALLVAAKTTSPFVLNEVHLMFESGGLV